ncbi:MULTISPECIES: carotenoid oxygenase family protein [unclassified Acidovorax]|uniref:carotenoid oxygenase family protein n=1 Tax=unclassified Acidovorax TaxID=2684926 RepID=UPI000C180839|nr:MULTISPECIES: carotenoid oxygenase family protein [unclassified Acidovorax]PIF17618.1 carotenoid cleavage dioxygenase [Acidovorax sp. 59]PKW03358.1 carotenoid cleavage dioxygenase [Acidovorax sp. 30]|eukprot:gene10263-10333_t
MHTEIFDQVKPTLVPGNHPYMTGAFQPNYTEYTVTDPEVIGEIPKRLNGVYLRNTQNPVHQPLGTYHVFDGDGMLHQLSFQNGRCEYRNRFLRTKGFMEEQAAGQALYAGLIDRPSVAQRPGWGARGGLKDTSATDVIVHAGSALTTFYQCGEPYRFDARTLQPLGVDAWAAQVMPHNGISAHPKVCPRTGDLLFFNYSKEAPYMHYGEVDKNNRLVHYVPVPLPGPRLPHDMVFTENFAILNDFQLHWDEALLAQNKHKLIYREDQPARFAVLPRRHAPQTGVRWFEASPTYVLHWLNAWEEGDELVLHGFHQKTPMPKAGYDNSGNTLGPERYGPTLYEWRLNLSTGKVSERRLDERYLEFGMINTQYWGKPYRYSYNMLAHPGSFLFDGVMRYDRTTGASQQYLFGEGRFGSESPMAPCHDAQSEDDGYVVTFVSDMNTDQSECLVLDARDLAAGPVARIKLPHRISSGTHSCWADASEIQTDWPGLA